MKRLARIPTVFALVACLAFLGCSDRATAPIPLENISLAKRTLGGGLGIVKDMGIDYDLATIVITDPSDGTLVTYCGHQLVEHNATIVQLQVREIISPVIVHIILATAHPTFVVTGGRYIIEHPIRFHCSETPEALLSFQMLGLTILGR